MGATVFAWSPSAPPLQGPMASTKSIGAKLDEYDEDEDEEGGHDECDDYETPDSEEEDWDGLDDDQKAAATDLGWDQEMWDCVPDDEEPWEADECEQPSSEESRWAELSSDEKKAAETLGWDKDSWETDYVCMHNEKVGEEDQEEEDDH